MKVRYQLKLRGGCAAKMLRPLIIEFLNARNKSTVVLCIGRKLRSFWVEWRSYHICPCSRMYILSNLIHQLHNIVFTSSSIKVHRFMIQSLIGNSGRMCRLSGCIWRFSFHCMLKPPQEKYISCKNTNILSLWFTDLSWEFTFPLSEMFVYMWLIIRGAMICFSHDTISITIWSSRYDTYLDTWYIYYMATPTGGFAAQGGRV